MCCGITAKTLPRPVIEASVASTRLFQGEEMSNCAKGINKADTKSSVQTLAGSSTKPGLNLLCESNQPKVSSKIDLMQARAEWTKPCFPTSRSTTLKWTSFFNRTWNKFNLTYLDAYLSYLDALELVIIDQQQVTNNSTGKESYSKKITLCKEECLSWNLTYFVHSALQFVHSALGIPRALSFNWYCCLLDLFTAVTLPNLLKRSHHWPGVGFEKPRVIKCPVFFFFPGPFNYLLPWGQRAFLWQVLRMRAEEWANLSARAAIGVHLPGSGPGTYSGFCMGGHVFHKRRNQTPHHIVPLRVFFSCQQTPTKICVSIL